MDSFAQFMLGAAIGQLIIGQKHHSKGALVGGVAATLQDLDVLTVMHLSPIEQLINHRGFSHSIIFSFTIPFVLAWFTQRYLSFQLTYKRWWGFWFTIFSTHILFDLMTTWGTQVFWPLHLRVSLDSWFIIDPLVTLPLVIGCIVTKIKKQQRAVKLALLFCFTYMFTSIGSHYWMVHRFKLALLDQHLMIQSMIVRPTPFNTLYWGLTAKTSDDSLIMGYGRLWDSISNIEIHEPISKNSYYLETGINSPQLDSLIKITKGYYVIQRTNKTLTIHDARYGIFGGWVGDHSDFIFNYHFDLETENWSQTRSKNNDYVMLFKSLIKTILN